MTLGGGQFDVASGSKVKLFRKVRRVEGDHMKSRRFKTLKCAALAIACLSPHGAKALEPVPMGRAYGIIDKTGEVVVPPACSQVSRFGDWVSLERDGKQGFANLRTKQSTGLIFESGQGFFNVPLFSLGPEPVVQHGKYGYVDPKGQAVIPFRYEIAGRFTEDGLAVVKVDGKYGYIDRRGDFVIPPRFDWASSFATAQEDELALVKIGGKSGYIDRHGELVIPPQFDVALGFNADGLAGVKIGNLWGAIDRRGRLAIPAKFDTLSLPPHGGLVIVRSNGRAGAVDTHGRIVVSLKFADVEPFGQNGLAAASLDVHPLALAGQSGHWGFIDRTGRFVVPPIYSSVSHFEDEQYRSDFGYAAFRAPLNLAAARSVDADGVETTNYIDQRGQVVLRLPKGMSGVHVNTNGVISVFDGRKPGDNSFSHRWGFFDPEKPAVPTTWFDSIGEFGDGDLAPVSPNMPTWGYIDRSGTVVIEPQFRNASAFTADGLASVQVKDPTSDRYSAALIDRTAKVRLQTSFDNISSFGDSDFATVVVNRRSAWDPIALPADQCSVRKD